MKLIITDCIIKQYKKTIKTDKKLDDVVIKKKIEALVEVASKNVINNKCIYNYQGSVIIVEILTNKVTEATFAYLKNTPELKDAYIKVGLTENGNKLVYHNTLPTAKEVKKIIKNNKYNIKFSLDENQLYPLHFVSGNDEFVARLDHNNLFEVKHLNDKFFLKGHNKNKLHSHLQRRYGKLTDMLESIHNHTRFQLEQDYRDKQLLNLLGINSMNIVNC
ncbi:hypothetical protein G8S49_06510 [Clostridium botulinum C]|uniref:Uncharacterized protein n=2 Tax=Clostridium botulinum TaxID=1491 RepID=A0A6G4DCF9_CLOBO|nr:hypothetical protein [Clostridium botulinum]MCD3196053.1 hypothetical protein [Clostridium botulinum C]MCD3200344.1 hypothetical protein [Clostridium botulinum C]MCD3206877.1 hypothetical protein [Clostridium botulinum C]MCD3207576.1 hypothetical protein [Clostridium botulinum C]MCD3226310.1 hypothetical protein [Clostridium botulinum C]